MQFPHQFDLLLPIVAERAHRVLPARHRAAEQTVALMGLVPIVQFEIHAGHAVARARAQPFRRQKFFFQQFAVFHEGENIDRRQVTDGIARQ